MKAVILAGGTGTRLWPLSRDLKPKQFHRFVGEQTMLQQTYSRLSYAGKENIFIATNIQYEPFVRQQLPDFPQGNIFIEPEMRDTGPSICYAARNLANLGFLDEVMAIIYADHLIENAQNFIRALEAAEAHVKDSNCISAVAVRAQYANPTLGYIKIGRLLSPGTYDFEVYELEQFVEKPSMERAKKFLDSYKYLWNTGLYAWKVGTILELFQKLAPDVYEATAAAEKYETAPKISVDYAIMEKVSPESVHVIPADLGWNDIGNWLALHQELTAKEDENIAIGEHLALDTEGSVIVSNSGKMVVAYGLKNIVIVDTPEALLVMSKDKATEVKRIIETLKAQKKEKFL